MLVGVHEGTKVADRQHEHLGRRCQREGACRTNRVVDQPHLADDVTSSANLEQHFAAIVGPNSDLDVASLDQEDLRSRVAFEK